MALRFIVVLGTLFCLGVVSGARSEEDKKYISSQIMKLKEQIDKEKDIGGKELGPLWAQLGMLYQGHDVRYHDGGTMQPLALEAYENAIRGTSDQSVLYTVYQRMGMLLKMMGRGLEAVDAHKSAFRLAADSEQKADALAQHANALGMLGDVTGSIQLLNKALRLHPKGLSLYLPLVTSHRELKDLNSSSWNELIGAMETAIGRKSRKSPLKLQLNINADIYWALFQANEAIGDYREAWRYLEVAHAATIATRERVSSVQMMDEQLDQVISVFNEDFFPSPSLGVDTRLPVFIVGMMRSGSTLLETMLDSHPAIYGMGEDSFFNSGLREFRDALVQSYSGTLDNLKTKSVIKQFVKSVVDKMVNQSLTDPANVDKSTSNEKPRRVVDKMLFNYRNIGFIHLAMPKAVILHTVRDPMDTLLSCFRHKFDDIGLDWALDVERLTKQYIDYLKLIAHFKKVLPGRVHDVSYEALVSDPEKTIRKVLQHVDVPWDADVLNYYKKNRTVHTHSMGQVRHNVSTSGIGGWRVYEKQLQPMIDILTPELQRLKKSGLLPFRNEMNWDLDANFDYGNPDPRIKKKSGGKLHKKPNMNGKRRKSAKSVKSIDRVVLSSDGESSVVRSRRRKENRSKRKRAKRGDREDKDKAGIEKRENIVESSSKIEKHSDLRNQVKILSKKYASIVNPSSLLSMKSQLPLPSKSVVVNDLLVLLYSLYLHGRYADAFSVLENSISLLPPDSNEPGIFYAATQILLSLNRHSDALTYANKLIKEEPLFTEAYLAKSVLLTQLGRFQDALEVDNIGYLKTNDEKILLQRGYTNFRLQKYKSAHSDFTAIKPNPDNEAEILALRGKCEKEFGDSVAAIESLTKALKLDSKRPDAYLDLGIVLMENGRIDEALAHINQSLALDPSVKITWGYAGLLYQTLGECKKAIYYLGKTLEIDPTDHTSLLLSAMCSQSELDFASSFNFFDRLLSIKGPKRAEANVAFHREVAFTRLLYLDTQLESFNYDNVVNPNIKVGLNKRQGSYSLPSDYNKSVAAAARELVKNEKVIPLRLSKKAREVLLLTKPLRAWIQLQSPGFLPHRRQHRMFGLAVLDMAQQLRNHVRLLKSGEQGLWVKNVKSSLAKYQASPGESHLFCYRDFLDIAVKWRQLADQFDIVFWLDRYPAKTPMDLVALSTSLYSGLKRNTRYYPYFNFTFNVFKTAMKERYFTAIQPTYTSTEKGMLISKAASLEDLFNISEASHVVFIVTECDSLVKPGRKLPGTRVSITKTPPEGYDLSIGSPTEENRFEMYLAEVERAYNLIIDAMVANKSTETIVDLLLELYYYWALWGPLSRGTAATGYAVIISVLLAVGEEVITSMPQLKQMDWEAILRTDPTKFRDAVRPWLSERKKTSLPSDWLDGTPGFKLSGDIFLTPRDIITTLSAPDDEV